MFASNVGVVPASTRFARITVVVSVLLHATAGLGLLAASFWKISKLTPRHEQVVLQTGGLRPPGDPAPPSAAPAERKPKRALKTPARTVQQPTPRQAVHPPPELRAGNTDTTDPGMDGGSGGGGDRDGKGTQIAGIGDGDGPAQVVPDIPPAPTVAKPVADVSQEMIEGQRIFGTKQILLPASVLTTLRNQGVSEVSARAQVCIDDRGTPASIAFRPSSNYTEVDGVLEREMRKWRYRPYLVRGEAVPACFIVTFKYRITS